MKLGVRQRLIAGAMVLILVGVLLPALWLAGELARQLSDTIEGELAAVAAFVQERVEAEPSPVEFDAFADRMARSRPWRVSIIGVDGTVLGDSILDPLELANISNHADRPEVALALSHGSGSARRRSATTGVETYYYSLRFARPDESGVVRISRPLADYRQAELRSRAIVVGAAAIGSLVVVAGTIIGARGASRGARRWLDRYRAASGDTRRTLVLDEASELGRLTRSFDRLAGDYDRAVQGLVTDRDRLGAVIDGMNVALIVVDRDQRIELVNPAARDLLRIEGSTAGRRLFEVTRAPGLSSLLARADPGEVAAELELPGPSPRRVSARVRPLADGAGHVLVLDDVTEVRRLETVRRDFVANVSHELRTPVSVILANAETLVDGAIDDTDVALRFLKAIHGNAQRLTRLITDLLDLSRIEAGRLNLSLRPIDLATALRNTAEALEQEIARRRHTVTIDVPAGLTADADPKALDQVLLNLFDNAVKYTPDGGRLRLSARTADGRVHVEVEDDGPGIEPRHVSRIFERFYRVDAGRSRELGGTGLGLAIVRNLVDAMGGSVGVDHVSPHGSRFWFTLEG